VGDLRELRHQHRHRRQRKSDVGYRLTFRTEDRRGNDTFLYSNGPVTSLGDENLLFRQYYTLSVSKGGGWEKLAEDQVAPSQLGRASIPDYGALRDQAIKELPGLLAVLLAAALGASHAMLPGRGKTVMTACLAGRRGTRRDALLVGATVTATHTAGVLALGPMLSISTALVPVAVPVAGSASGSFELRVGHGRDADRGGPAARRAAGAAGSASDLGRAAPPDWSQSPRC
jgi:Domain of unknown function (DUF4331)